MYRGMGQQPFPYPGQGFNNRRFPPFPNQFQGPKPMGGQQRGPNQGGRMPPSGSQNPRGPMQGGNRGGNMQGNNRMGGQNRGPMQQTGRPGTNMQPKQQPQQLPKPNPTELITVQNLRKKLNEFLGWESDKQRQILGELLYPKVSKHTTPDLAPKITGMLIDLSVLEVQEILEFLEDDSVLQERVTEAAELIRGGGVE